MAIPEDVINEIKYRNDIETVISPYVSLKRRGKNLVGLCPFHNEKTPSFTVYPENGSFYCFGCGAGGDVFSFVKLIENLDYIEAVKLLAERSGVALPQDGYDDSMQRLKNSIFEINRETARFYHAYLMSPEGKWALDYLRGRGLSIATIKHFGLGAAPDGWDSLINHLKSKGFSIADMLQANVIGKSQRGSFYDRFRKRVMFPIINIRGKVIGFSGRAMPGEDKAGGKYVNTADTPVYKKSENLFAMNFAKNHCDERIILVEGNMDVISLHQAGFTNAVAALGTSFTGEQARLLSRYTEEVVLIMDSDAAGQKATERAISTLSSIGLNTRVVNIPDGKDPDEFINNNGADKFSALLEGASSDIDYKLFKAAAGFDLEKNSDKVLFLNKAAEVLSECYDDIAIDMYSGRLAEKYGVAKSTILEKIKDNKIKNRKKQRNAEIKSVISPKINRDMGNPDAIKFKRAVNAEETVLSIIIKHPDIIKEIDLLKEDFVSELSGRIFKDISDIYNRGLSFDISLFAEDYTSQEIGYITSISIKNDMGDNYKKLFYDAISVIKEEKEKLKEQSVDSMGEDDWTSFMNNLIEKKVKKDG